MFAKRDTQYALLVYPVKQPSPTDRVKQAAVAVPRHPDHGCFSHDVVGRHETPVARVERVVAVVTHHPIIIHGEGVRSGGLAVDENMVAAFFESVTFVNGDEAAV